MGLENDDIEIDRKVAQRRHEELLKALSDLLPKPVVDDGLKPVIEQHIRSVNDLVKAMVNMPKPVVNVPSNNHEIVNPIKDIAAEICAHLESLKECLEPKPTEITFTVIRNPAGFITNVVAKSK